MVVVGALTATVGLGLGLGLPGLDARNRTVTATMGEPDTAVVVIQPGVLDLLGANVTVTATAQDADQQVVLARAPASDVAAWVGDAAYTAITGLENWSTLAVAAQEGEATVPNPAGSDLWRDETVGTGKVVVEITAGPNPVSVLAATDGTAPAPRLTLEWHSVSESPIRPAQVAIGALLALFGLGVLGYDAGRRRAARARRDALEKSKRIALASVTETAVIPVVPAEPEPLAGIAMPEPPIPPKFPDVPLPALDEPIPLPELDEPIPFPESEEAVPLPELDVPAAPLTRRQMRELERQAEAARTGPATPAPVTASDGSRGAGILPGVPDPDRYRALREFDATPAPEPATPLAHEPATPFEPELPDPFEPEPATPFEPELAELAPSGDERDLPPALLPDAPIPLPPLSPAERQEAGEALGAAIVPNVLPARRAAIAEERAAAGRSKGSAVLPDSLYAAARRAMEDRDAAAGTAGAGVVPPRSLRHGAPREISSNDPSSLPDGAPLDVLPSDSRRARAMWRFPSRKPREDQQ